MSRFANKDLNIIEKAEINLSETEVKVKGSKGELSFPIPSEVKIEKNESVLKVIPQTKMNPRTRAMTGMVYSQLRNMMLGVTEGFEKKLEVQGVGFRWQVKGSAINLQLGFSHDVSYDLPEGVEAKAEGNTLTLSGIDKQVVGFAADKIKSYRPVEPYKGKGVRYVGEHVIRKAGKSGGK